MTCLVTSLKKMAGILRVGSRAPAYFRGNVRMYLVVHTLYVSSCSLCLESLALTQHWSTVALRCSSSAGMCGMCT